MLYKDAVSHYLVMEDKGYNDLLGAIAANIRKFRKKKGLTQEDMVDHGFNYRYYQKLESGHYSFNLYTLHRLSKVLGNPVKDFFR